MFDSAGKGLLSSPWEERTIASFLPFFSFAEQRGSPTPRFFYPVGEDHVGEPPVRPLFAGRPTEPILSFFF